MNVTLELTEAQLEAIAVRAAEIVLERGGGGNGASPSPWLSVDEAAAFLRCEPQRIYEMRSDGRLSAFKEGGRAIVSRAELEVLVVKAS